MIFNIPSLYSKLQFARELNMTEQYAMELASSSVLPMVLKSTIELGVLEIISKSGPQSPLSSSQIASNLPTKNPNAHKLLDKMLSLLASHSILTCSVSRTGEKLFGLTPVAEYFIPNNDGASLSPLMAAIQDKLMVNMWFYTKDAVLNGGFPFENAYDMKPSEYFGKDERYSIIFRTAMREYNSLFMKKVLKIYDGFERVKCLVDVGGGDGSVLNMILSKYPDIKGVNFDLAPIIEKLPSYSGIEHVCGDMLVEVPKGYAMFMKWVLHSLDDEDALKLLKNCYDALADHGKVIVVDLVVPEFPDTNVAVKSLLQQELFMMNLNKRAERALEEFEFLARSAGFCGVRVACCAYNVSVVEIYKTM